MSKFKRGDRVRKIRDKTWIADVFGTYEYNGISGVVYNGSSGPMCAPEDFFELAPPHDRAEAAIRTLERLGYTHDGGEMWVAPMQSKPAAEIRQAFTSFLRGDGEIAVQNDGIVGWHRNGDIASWEELLPEVDIAIASVEGAA